MKKIFKIRNKEGLYSTGGIRPEWTKNGKSYNGINHIKTHLKQFCNETNNIPDDWKVVEFSIVEFDSFNAKTLYPSK